MPRVRAVLLVLALVAVLVPGAAVAADEPSPPTEGEIARVVDVIDGDTIRIERADGSVERVRYIGMDTPEIGHDPGEPDEAWGRQATESNSRLVDRQDVLLERDVSDTDQYDRLLRYVWVEYGGDWLMVNGELVSLGLAEVRAYEPDTRHHDWFRQLEAEAREAGLGLHGGDPDTGSSLLDDILDFFFGG